ncbi:MAG TPA: hypothetical protein VJ991_09470 [Balneolales bacterium]|nr:hypothetical protein [Balneolales bacterium]
MINEFSAENIDLIGKIFDTKVKRIGDVSRLEIVNEQSGRKLALEIHIGLDVDGETMNMVSVYAQNTFLQLHNCTGFIVSDLLNQVTFFGKSQGKVSGLIVEKEAGCSLYANVNESLLTGDFTKLPTEVMMCSVALSLTDTIDLDGFSFDED